MKHDRFNEREARRVTLEEGAVGWRQHDGITLDALMQRLGIKTDRRNYERTRTWALRLAHLGAGCFTRPAHPWNRHSVS